MLRPRIAAALPLLVLLPLLAVACDSGFSSPDEDTAPIDEDTFIETYVQLRLAALEQGGLPEEDRERILDENEVTVDDLRAFIDVHGRNVPYMYRVWTEVDRRIDEAIEDRGPAGRPGGAEAPGGPGGAANEPGPRGR